MGACHDLEPEANARYSSLLTCCRCHPSIAAISHHSFYGGRLLDGCTAADRAPLLPGLPPVVCLDVRGSQQFAGGSGSASNQAEAQAVVQVRPGHEESIVPPDSSACNDCLHWPWLRLLECL